MLSEHFNIICKSYDPSLSCDGLMLEVPPFEYVNGTNVMKQKAFLECIDYGCTNITTIAGNGIDDIAVTAVLCDCGAHGANGESGDSCIGVINIQCDDGTATFDGETCNGYTDCCGMIEQETYAAVCSAQDGSPGMSNGAIVGVLAGVIILVLLIVSLGCYYSNQQSMRFQTEQLNKSNPITQSILEEKEVKLQSAAGSRTKTVNTKQGGYGAVSDDDAAHV